MKTSITHKEGKTINWNKAQLVKSKKTELVILTNGKHSEVSFKGTVVNGNFYVGVGIFSEVWAKEAFEFFEGEIVITQ